MRREHVAEIGSRGRAEPRGAGSLALRTGLRLVGNHRGPSSPHVLCRMAALSCTDDSRRSAARPIRQRSTRSYCGGGPGPCDRGDSENPNPHRRQVYPLYGPVEFTYAEIAQVLSRVLGRQVQYKQVSIETMLTMMASGGEKPPPGHNARALYGEFEPKPEGQGDSFAIQHLREVAINHQNGIFAGTNDLIEKIGGRPPMTLEEFINKHRAAFAA